MTARYHACYHNITDYFPVTAHSVMFYFIHIKWNNMTLLSHVLSCTVTLCSGLLKPTPVLMSSEISHKWQAWCEKYIAWLHRHVVLIKGSNLETHTSAAGSRMWQGVELLCFIAHIGHVSWVKPRRVRWTFWSRDHRNVKACVNTLTVGDVWGSVAVVHEHTGGFRHF